MKKPTTFQKISNIYNANFMASLPKAYIFDFDGTITTKDTISVIANAAISFQVEHGKDLTQAWQGIAKAYEKDYEEFVSSYEPKKERRETLEEEVSFMRSLKGVEERSFERVSLSGLFRGIGEDAWERMGRTAVEKGDIEIRKGFTEFLSAVEKSGGVWGVVSVNFSRAFIRGVLRAANIEVEPARVVANQADERGIVSAPRSKDGMAREPMTTSAAKLSAMRSLLKTLGIESHGGVVYYFGDSPTDLECLVEDGVEGILFTADGKGSLIKTIRGIGMEIPHVEEYQVNLLRGLYWAREFTELSPLTR